MNYFSFRILIIWEAKSFTFQKVKSQISYLYKGCHLFKDKMFEVFVSLKLSFRHYRTHF